MIEFRLFALLPSLLLCLAAPQANAEDIKPKLDEPMAQKLAAKSHDGSTEYLNSYSYEGDDPTSPFFVFDGMGPVNGSFGFFAVNKWTGDVWNLWDCKIISNAASRKIQAQIRQRFTPAEMKQYKRLAAIKPGCLNDGVQE